MDVRNNKVDSKTDKILDWTYYLCIRFTNISSKILYTFFVETNYFYILISEKNSTRCFMKFQ